MGSEASAVYAVPLAINLFILGRKGAPETVKEAIRREIQTFMLEFLYQLMYREKRERYKLMHGPHKSAAQDARRMRPPDAFQSSLA